MWIQVRTIVQTITWLLRKRANCPVFVDLRTRAFNEEAFSFKYLSSISQNHAINKKSQGSTNTVRHVIVRFYINMKVHQAEEAFSPHAWYFRPIYPTSVNSIVHTTIGILMNSGFQNWFHLNPKESS